MKKQHIILTLLFGGIAAYFLIEAHNLQCKEAIVSEELNMLRNAVKKSPAAAKASLLTGNSNRQHFIDTTKLIAELSDILKAPPSEQSQKRLQDFLTVHGTQLESAPLAKLKEISNFLEKDFPFDQAGTEGAQLVWFGVVRLAAKRDPAWAFSKFDQAAATTKIPINMQLTLFKSLANNHGEFTSPTLATALQKWLDTALTNGRIEANNPQVLELRTALAMATGNDSTAIKNIAALPINRQQQAASDYAKNLQTPEDNRRAMEELSTTVNRDAFQSFVSKMIDLQGVETARDILAYAALSAEQHDAAAARIASSTIGEHSKDNATWLFESLRSADHQPLQEFTTKWTHGDYVAAANWVNTLPAGAKRDAALRGFIPAAAKVDGATAMHWAQTISEPLLRNQIYNEAHTVWSRTDAAQADTYRQQHPLDQEAVMSASKPQ